MKQCLFSAFQAHVERMEKEATLSEEIPAKRERKHSSNTSNPDTVDVKNGHSTHEVGIHFFFLLLILHVLDMLICTSRNFSKVNNIFNSPLSTPFDSYIEFLKHSKTLSRNIALKNRNMTDK